MFIKLELQELICLLGKLAKDKAVLCPICVGRWAWAVLPAWGGRGIALAAQHGQTLLFLAQKLCFDIGSVTHLHCYRLPHLNLAGAEVGGGESHCILSRGTCCCFPRAILGVTLSCSHPPQGSNPGAKTPLAMRPASGLQNADGHGSEDKISARAKGSSQNAHMWLSHFKQLRYRHTSSLSRNLPGEGKKDICLASAASSYLGRRKLLMFMFHISGAQNRFWCLKQGSGGTCFKYVTVSERSSLITSLSNAAENGLKPKPGRGALEEPSPTRHCQH